MSNISDFKIENGILIKYTGNEKHIVIPDGVTKIEYNAFWCCKSIVSLTIAEGVTTIGNSAFFGCTSLSKVIIPDSVTSIGWNSFGACTKLSSIKVSNNFLSANTNRFSGRFEKYHLPILAFENFDKNSTLSKYVLKNKEACVESIIKASRIDLLYKFLECCEQISVEIFDELIKKAVELNCSEAASLFIEYKNKYYPPEKLEKIERDKFEKAVGLKEYTIADWRKIFKFITKEGKTTITGYKGFDTDVIIPQKIGKNIVSKIGEGAFGHCQKLTSITIPESVTNIGFGAFYSCDLLVKIDIKGNITTIEHGTFEHCTSLESITIPDSVTNIGFCAFRDCTSLTSITLPKGVTHINLASFCRCKSLTNINIPESVIFIDYNAFEDCTSLSEITIPKTVKTINKDAFKGCEHLTIKCEKGSVAEKYAKEHNISFEIIQ